MSNCQATSSATSTRQRTQNRDPIGQHQSQGRSRAHIDSPPKKITNFHPDDGLEGDACIHNDQPIKEVGTHCGKAPAPSERRWASPASRCELDSLPEPRRGSNYNTGITSSQPSWRRRCLMHNDLRIPASVANLANVFFIKKRDICFSEPNGSDRRPGQIHTSGESGTGPCVGKIRLQNGHRSVTA